MHDLDPNALGLERPSMREFRIYGDDRASMWALVDEIDYQWAVKWRWSSKKSRGGRKIYLRRNVTTSNGSYYCEERGGVLRDRKQKTLFLHTAIMQRMGDVPPTNKHLMIDHRNGNGLDCRRANLRWASASMNRRNINGKLHSC